MTTQPSVSAERELRLRVRARRDVTARIAEFVLEDVAGYRLPPWAPGAHINLRLDGGDRQFSLCGDPRETDRYRIAVLREEQGRGGSAWIHDHLQHGDAITAGAPLNHFELEPAGSYHLIAAGVGITPILPMAAQLERRGANWRLTYLGHGFAAMAYLDELQCYGKKVTLWSSTERRHRAAPQEILAQMVPGEAVYACGPESLLVGLEEALASTATDLHLERFAPKDRTRLEETGETFEVELGRSGELLSILPGVSILEAIEATGLQPDYSCREGTCGTCETRILAGHADHRDSILTPEEQADDEVMMICVSRSKSPRLVLDI
ncbi:PDR/VanB family oxidoreductase [Microbacterium sp.]|uniref:PDR/VanB family oxidoreductase n=1 Tax=Microbacterium sp. TaxID=51671 RepID=UPI003A9185DD